MNQPFAGAALVAVRNQWSDDLVDIIVDNVGCGRPQGPPLQGITSLPKLELLYKHRSPVFVTFWIVFTPYWLSALLFLDVDVSMTKSENEFIEFAFGTFDKFVDSLLSDDYYYSKGLCIIRQDLPRSLLTSSHFCTNKLPRLIINLL